MVIVKRIKSFSKSSCNLAFFLFMVELRDELNPSKLGSRWEKTRESSSLHERFKESASSKRVSKSVFIPKPKEDLSWLPLDQLEKRLKENEKLLQEQARMKALKDGGAKIREMHDKLLEAIKVKRERDDTDLALQVNKLSIADKHRPVSPLKLRVVEEDFHFARSGSNSSD